MLQPHPQNIAMAAGVPTVSEVWDSWFKDTRDQVHLGEAPEGTQSVVSSGITLPAEVTGLLIRVVSYDAGNVDVTEIQAGFDGQKITIEGESDTKTVTLKEGGNIILGGSDVVISNNIVINLHYNANKALWIKN